MNRMDIIVYEISCERRHSSDSRIVRVAVRVVKCRVCQRRYDVVIFEADGSTRHTIRCQENSVRGHTIRIVRPVRSANVLRVHVDVSAAGAHKIAKLFPLRFGFRPL
jgi:hypothetical protein